MYLLFLVVPFFGTAAALLFHLPYIAGIALFYLLPGLVMDARMRSAKNACMHFVYSAIIAFPFAIVVDYFGTAGGLWYVPRSVLHWRLMDVIPMEDPLWLIAALYLITSPLLDPVDKKSARYRLTWFALASLCAIIALIAVTLCPRSIEFRSKWAYLAVVMICFVLPAVGPIANRRQSFRTILPIALYFGLCTVLFEMSAAILRWWIFPGAYLLPSISGWGFGPVPLDELLFVGALGPIIGAAIYGWIPFGW